MQTGNQPMDHNLPIPELNKWEGKKKKTTGLSSQGSKNTLAAPDVTSTLSEEKGKGEGKEK